MISFIRFIQQAMIVISIVLPGMLAARTSDMVRGLFLCFLFASILNVFFVMGGTETNAVFWDGSRGFYFKYLGSPGYFMGKNTLGECAAATFLLSLYKILDPGRWRVLGIIGVAVAISLTVASNSKTALALALVCPFLSGLTLVTRKVTRISPAIIMSSIALSCIVVASVSHYNLNFVSYKLYGDPTLTGRTVIWDFVQKEIDSSPLLGWGYESFWLVPGSPALSEAPGWVKTMPNGHNGYYDTMLDLGYVGFAFLLVFIIATLHGIGRVADRDPVRAWFMLSFTLFFILYNFLERLWMHGFEFLWVAFVIIVVEIARYYGPFPPRSPMRTSTIQPPGAPSRSPGSRVPHTLQHR